jgi:hypothetical protein
LPWIEPHPHQHRSRRAPAEPTDDAIAIGARAPARPSRYRARPLGCSFCRDPGTRRTAMS